MTIEQVAKMVTELKKQGYNDELIYEIISERVVLTNEG